MKYIFVELTARDVTFSDKAQEFFAELLSRADNDNVKKYINKTFRTYIINEYKRVTKKTKALPSDPEWMKKKIANHEDVFILKDFTASEKEKFKHYIDYLNTLDSNKPIKLSVLDLVKQVKEWDKHLKKKSEEEKDDISEDGIEDIKKYKTGFRWVKITGRNSLKREGELMGHCVGGYWNKVNAGRCSIYSLRDKHNKPHVTIEILSNHDIEQIRGKANIIPSEKYTIYVKDFIQSKFVKQNKMDEKQLALMGYIIDNGKFYHICNLPENITVPVINLIKYKSHEIKFPKNLTVNGYMDLLGSNIKELPENLTVKGDLRIDETDISKLPDNLKANGLYGKKDQIKEIGKNVSITKLYSENIDSINNLISLDNKVIFVDDLPDNLEKDELNLANTNISRLPKNLKVNRLVLANTNLKSIPEDMNVKELIISGTSISKLPKNLKCHYLDISNTNITELPDGLNVDLLVCQNLIFNKISKNIKIEKIYEAENLIKDGDKILISDQIKEGTVFNDNQDWYNLNIGKLPNNLVFNKDFILPSRVEEIPNGLVVKGRLVINSNDILEIGDNINIKYCHIADANIYYLPNIMPNMNRDSIPKLMLEDEFYEFLKNNKNINSSLLLDETDITRLPDGLTINGSLHLTNSSIEELPESLTVKDTIYMENTDINVLPSGLTAKEVQISSLESYLPDDIKIETLSIGRYGKYSNSLDYLEPKDFDNIGSIWINNKRIELDDIIDEDYDEYDEDE